MAADQFDIYQNAGGVTAVTNAVQRKILAALQESDRQLPELVQITGKAKPTLSGVHMKELVNRDLVVELPHPTDSRRKIYRLNAKPLGSSGVPVDELRHAVKQYAAGALSGQGLPLAAAFEVLAAAPGKTTARVLEAQAIALGRAWADRIEGSTARAFAMAFSQFVEREGLAEHLQIDFEALTFRCRPGPRAQAIPAARMGLLLAAFAKGVAEEKGMPEVSFSATEDDGAFRLRPA